MDFNGIPLAELTDDQLEKELGGADPEADARAAEEQIQAAAGRAFQGKPELSAFTGSK